MHSLSFCVTKDSVWLACTYSGALLPRVGCCLTIIHALKSLSCLQGGPGKAGTPSKLHTTEQPAQLVSVLEANDLTEMMSMVGC